MSRLSKEIWSEKNVERLIKLVSKYNVQQIAEIMNLSHSTVSAKIRRLRAQGILDESNSRHSQNAMAAKWTDEETEQLTQMYVYEGISTPRIAKALNKSISAVQCKVARMHLKREVKCKQIPVKEQAEAGASKQCEGCIKRKFCYEHWGADAYLVGGRCR